MLPKKFYGWDNIKYIPKEGIFVYEIAGKEYEATYDAFNKLNAFVDPEVNFSHYTMSQKY